MIFQGGTDALSPPPLDPHIAGWFLYFNCAVAVFVLCRWKPLVDLQPVITFAGLEWGGGGAGGSDPPSVKNHKDVNLAFNVRPTSACLRNTI